MRKGSTHWREKILLFKCSEDHKHSSEICELGKLQRHFVDTSFNDSWRRNMKLKSNKILPNLDRCEGGMGGDRDTFNRQLRYPIYFSDNISSIRICLKNPKNLKSNDFWTNEEIEDLISSFILTAKDFGINVYINRK